MLLKQTEQLYSISILASIKKQLDFALVCEGVSAISKFYISICKNLMHVVKSVSVMSKQTQYLSQLKQCIELLIILLQSTQFEKYGHIFSAFRLVIKEYERLVDQKVGFVNQNKLFERIELNQKVMWPQRPVEIQNSEIDFRQSDKAHEFFTNLVKCEGILHDSQCVCCSRGFVKDMIIQNRNTCIPVLVQSSTQQCMNKSQLLKALCAICNGGGGVMIVGPRKQKGCLVAYGAQFKSEQELIQLQKQIRACAMEIQPKCFFKIDRVPVYSSLMQQNQSKLAICIRILIYSLEKSKTNYIQFRNKGYHSIYEIYQYNADLKPVKITNSSPNDNGTGIYNKIHQIHSKNKTQNNHRNISCYLPRKNFTIIYGTQNQTKDQMYEKQTQIQGEQADKNIPKNQLKFKYKYTSLLIVGSSKSKRYIDSITDYLTDLKQLFEIQKCFPEYFEGTARSVWMLSHNKNYNQIKNCLNAFQEDISMKPGTLVTMPVHRSLQIQRSKLSQFNQAHLIKKFHLRYKCQPEIDISQITDKKNGEKKKMIELQFANYSQAIFAYMIFEELQLRPYFVKSGSKQK